MNKEEKIYQRIGEFAVSFQWIENKLREIGWIGWFILDPAHSEWPPSGLRNLTNEKLIDQVHGLFVQALPKCRLDPSIESELKDSFTSCIKTLHQLRRDRNRILHSAFIELNAGGDVQGIMRSNPRLGVELETGEYLFDTELLTPESFSEEIRKMAEAAVILNNAYTQLIHRYPNGGAEYMLHRTGPDGPAPELGR